MIDYARILRSARAAAGWTLAEVGARTGYSASTVSRWETRPRTWRADELRRVARALRIPLHTVGLAEPDAPEPGGDPMRRRTLLGAGIAAAAAITMPTGADGTIEGALFGRPRVAPVTARALAAEVAAAAQDLHATRYHQLARRLPRLLAVAYSTSDAAATADRVRVAGLASRAHLLSAQLLIKLHDNALAAVSADRAQRYAETASDPLLTAEATREAAVVVRRGPGGGTTAIELLTAAAAELDSLEHAPTAAQLLAAAAYTAALRDDRCTAELLLDDAVRTLSGAPQAPARPGVLDSVQLAGYRISVARQLGDYGVAVDHARAIDPARLGSPERRARYWEDTALALYGRGRNADAADTLLRAEQDVPQEIRCRPWAQQLTAHLLAAPGATWRLRDLAVRIGVG